MQYNLPNFSTCIKNNTIKSLVMNTLLIKPSKKVLTKSQATFNRLIKKIENIQCHIKETEVLLSHGLNYYHSNVRPVEKKMLEKLSECIPIFYSYYKYPRSKLSKNERETLKELIQSLLTQLANHVNPQEINEEIREIIKDIEGIDIKEMINDGLDAFKKEMSDYAEAQGLNIDLSNIHATDSKEEMTIKFQKAFIEASENKKEEETDAIGTIKEKIKKKTKQQLKNEQREREVEEIQKKGLSKIYKQLAKTLHPDLEMDPIVKAEKETLMKKLTVAYDNQDLHTLLSLEITWMNRTASNSESYLQDAEDQLIVYNALLKDQVKSLEEELDALFMHPKYRDIKRILNHHPQSSIIEILKDEKQQFSSDLKRYTSSIIELKEGTNFKRIKEILKEFGRVPDFFEMLKFYL